MTGERFDPAANDTRYSLDYASYLVCRERPATVHVASREAMVAEAVARRLPASVVVTVPPEVVTPVSARLARPISAGTGEGVDAVVVPFASGEWTSLPPAPLTVVTEYNALSYKSLLAPGRLRLTAGDVTRWMRTRGVIMERIGLMGPDFITVWALAGLAGRYRSDWYFRLNDLAMQRLFYRGPLWRFCYVVILAGRAG